MIYDMTTEDIIDIGNLNYDWLLKDAKEDLTDFVNQFNLDKVGLTETSMKNLCPEVNICILS